MWQLFIFICFFLLGKVSIFFHDRSKIHVSDRNYKSFHNEPLDPQRWSVGVKVDSNEALVTFNSPAAERESCMFAAARGLSCSLLNERPRNIAPLRPSPRGSISVRPPLPPSVPSFPLFHLLLYAVSQRDHNYHFRSRACHCSRCHQPAIANLISARERKIQYLFFRKERIWI